MDKVENESYSKIFEKYPLPCFLILDSMGGKGTINPEIERLILGLRHWLTNQSDLNKKGHKLDEINMPYFIVECVQQPNSYDCGFYVFRNIVGMMADKRISSVIMKHIFKKGTKETFQEILKSNQNQKEIKKYSMEENQ